MEGRVRTPGAPAVGVRGEIDPGRGMFQAKVAAGEGVGFAEGPHGHVVGGPGPMPGNRVNRATKS